MAIAHEGTSTTGRVNSATPIYDLPSGIVAGEVLIIAYYAADQGMVPSATGWSVLTVNGGGETAQIGILYKEATGSEGSTVDVTITSSGWTYYVASRISGVDVDDITNSDNYNSSASAGFPATVTMAADTLTGLTSGDGCLYLMGCETTRTVVTQDSDLDLLGAYNNARMIQSFIDVDTGGTGNQEYVNEMSATRVYSLMLINLKQGAGGGPVSIIPTIMHNRRQM